MYVWVIKLVKLDVILKTTSFALYSTYYDYDKYRFYFILHKKIRLKCKKPKPYQEIILLIISIIITSDLTSFYSN